MANREKGESNLTVDGKDYTLVLSSEALASLETMASKVEGRRVNFVEALDIAKGGSWTYQRILVWASLREHHPEVTLKEAGDLMLASVSAEVGAAVTELAQTTVPDMADIKALGVKPRPHPAQGTRERKRRAPTTGETSTSTHAASV